MEEKLIPAINIQTEAKAELSSEEFQRQLYSWFEDRGLLSELRAHLRMQMINILKNTSVGKPCITQTVSPKLQALNMLIGEFFLHQEYHYSLCVFTTEVPLANVFPDITHCAFNKNTLINNEKKLWKFSEKDMWDLLETLGIMKDSKEGNSIANLYFANNEESLLSSLMRIIYHMKLVENTNKQTEKKSISLINLNEKQLNTEYVFESVAEILLQFKVSKEYIKQIIELLKFIINQEKKALEDVHKKEFIIYKDLLKEEVSMKVQEYKKREKDIEKLFYSEKSILEKELLKTQTHLGNCTDSLQKRYEEFESKYQELRNKEIEIEKKEENINALGKKLNLELEAMYVEKVKIEEIKKQLEMNIKLSKTPENVPSLKNIKPCKCEDKIQQTPNHVDIENSLLKQTIKQMQIENSNLKTQNLECQNRVRELAEHAKKIKSDLQAYESRYTMRISGRSRNAFSATVPVLSMPTLPTQRNVNVHNTGNGEEISSYPASPCVYRTQLHDLRRKPIHRKSANCSTSSEEITYTEDILQETKQRLRDLEIESEKIDKNFKEYNNNKPVAKTVCDKEIRNTIHDRNGTNGRLNNITSAPSTSFGFCDVPSTSAANVFQFPLSAQQLESSMSDIFPKKCLKNISENRLFFQSNNKLKFSPELKSKEVANKTNTEEADGCQDERNKSSGQSANSSGLLNDIMPVISFSTVDLSSDQANTSDSK